MPSDRRLSTALVAVGTAAAVSLVLTPGAEAADTRPGSPTCSLAETGIGYRVTWKRPTDDGGASIRRYVVKVQGREASAVRLVANTANADNPIRSIDWTRADAGSDPTFLVRAGNGVGMSRWCSTNPDAGEEEPPPPPPPGDGDNEPSGNLPYTKDSFFKSRVDGSSVPIDQARTTQFHSFMRSHPDQGGQGITWPKINVNPDWAMSYHVGKASDPIWRLTGGNTGDSRLRILQTQGFHMADSVANTFPTGDQDRPGVMIDSVFGYTVQFADAVPNKSNRTINVSNAGIMWHNSNGLDYRNPRSNDDRNLTSRGRILDAMVIRRDILDQAISDGSGLGHVLHLYFVETDTSAGVTHPMVSEESGKEGWGAEGERIRIKPSVNLEARGLTGAALAVARTLQQNGAYLGDNSGSSTQIKASQPHNYVGTNLTTDAFKGKITWADFEVIKSGWQ